MQYWITVLNLSGWKAHFITLQLEFFNFLSLASGKLECFAILSVGLDINLEKPSFIEGGTMGCLAFALVSTLFRHSHSSPVCFSWVQNLGEVNSVSLFHWLFMSHQCWFLCSHFSPSLSASPLWHLWYQLCLLLLARVAKSSHTVQGASIQLQGKKVVANLGTWFKLPGARPHCLKLTVYPLRVRRRVVVKQSFGRWERATNTSVDQSPPVGGCLNYASRKSCYDSATTGAGGTSGLLNSLLMSTDIHWPNTRVPSSQIQCQTNDSYYQRRNTDKARLSACDVASATYFPVLFS